MPRSRGHAARVCVVACKSGVMPQQSSGENSREPGKAGSLSQPSRLLTGVIIPRLRQFPPVTAW